MTTGDRRLARSLGWCALLAALVIGLRLAGSGGLAAPPLGSLDALTDWADARTPEEVAFALVRFVAEAVSWYLVALTAMHGIASMSRSHGLGRLADALALPGADRIVRGGLGLGMVASTAIGAAGASPPGNDAGDQTTATMAPVDEAGTARMGPVRDQPTSTSTATSQPTVAGTTTLAFPATWTVADGESFWSIAEDLLADLLGRSPADAEIDPYWRALIDANRSRLVDSADPNMIHAGQVFEVPPPH